MPKWIQNNSHYIIIYLVFFLFFLLLTPLGNFSEWINPNDHTGYYSITRIDPGDDTRIHAYLRSMVIDGDIDFFNEKGLWNRFELTPTGYSVDFMYALGSNILWLPFFLIGHFIAYIYSWLGFPVSTDGYSFPYLVMTGIGSSTYLFLGVILCYELLKNFFTKRTALIAALTVCLGTFMPFYAFIRSRMAHANEFFMVTLILYLWFHIRKRPDAPFYIFIFGVASGILGLVRLDDLPILAFFGVDFIILLFKRYRLKDMVAVKNMIKGAAAFAVILSLILSIPFICANIIWGNPLTIAGTDGKSATVKKKNANPLRLIYKSIAGSQKKNLYDFFLSKDKGLFLSSPFWLFALFGLYYFWKKERYWGALLIIGLSYPFIFNMIKTSTGLEYGNRKTTSALPFLVFGFAAFFEYTRINKYKWKEFLILFTGAILILWQYLQIIQHKVVMAYDHPTFIITAFKNIPKVLFDLPDLLLRSTSWMNLIFLKDFQLNNFKDFFFLIGVPLLQIASILLTALIFKKISASIKNYKKYQIHPFIKLTSFVAGMFFLFLPIFIIISNPKKTVATIEERQDIAGEIKKEEEKMGRSAIFLDEDQIYFMIALLNLEKQKTGKAEVYFKKAISRNPANLQPRFALGKLYYQTQRVEQAIREYQKAIKIDSENPLTYKKLGILYLNLLKDYDKALFNFRKSLNLSPQQEDAKRMEMMIKKLDALKSDS